MWHNPVDGIELFLRAKKLEKGSPNSRKSGKKSTRVATQRAKKIGKGSQNSRKPGKKARGWLPKEQKTKEKVDKAEKQYPQQGNGYSK